MRSNISDSDADLLGPRAGKSAISLGLLMSKEERLNSIFTGSRIDGIKHLTEDFNQQDC